MRYFVKKSFEGSLSFRTLKFTKTSRAKMTWSWCACTFSVIWNVPRNKMGTFLHVLSEHYRIEHFFGADRSVLTEHLELLRGTFTCISYGVVSKYMCVIALHLPEALHHRTHTGNFKKRQQLCCWPTGWNNNNGFQWMAFPEKSRWC